MNTRTKEKQLTPLWIPRARDDFYGGYDEAPGTDFYE